jgi:hypothetical protein
MTAAATFASLSMRERFLLVETTTTLVAVQLGLRLFSIERLRRWAGRKAPVAASADRVVWAVDAVARRLPGCSCLVSALALQRLLSRRGQPSELHVGVAKQGARLAAHAWLESGGRILIGESEGQTFAPLLSWKAGRS